MPKNVKKSESSAVPPTAFPATQPKEDKQGDKRSIASLARDGKLPRTKKDTNLDDHWNEKNLSVAAHDTAPSVDKENFAPSAPPAGKMLHYLSLWIWTSDIYQASRELIIFRNRITSRSDILVP
ncbi:hypothetical protein Hamer_G027463 [Homarus americanus]|uniref:Uncharacterized protein n=1 Tax=Homarus americanus TaxID=6706 RepID=A0A8J5MPN6_HOMAM|nr:hypothetical protein Hamer_G027463 [Homarus americanus]